MTDLSKIVMQFAADEHTLQRADLEQALQAFERIEPSVVAYETASKRLPKIRKSAERHEPSVFTRGGASTLGKDSTLLISVEQFAEAVVSVIAYLKKEAAERRPADSILDEITAIKGRGRSIDVGLGSTEETAGGHVRF